MNDIRMEEDYNLELPFMQCTTHLIVGVVRAEEGHTPMLLDVWNVDRSLVVQCLETDLRGREGEKEGEEEGEEGERKGISDSTWREVTCLANYLPTCFSSRDRDLPSTAASVDTW